MTVITSNPKSLSKESDDIINQQLIDDHVYRMTTTEINPLEEELRKGLLNQQPFETRGIISVIISIIVVTLILLSYLYIQVFHTTSIFHNSTNDSSINGKRNSTWKTIYDLPDDILVIEIYSSSLNFSSECPAEKFALVVNLDTPANTVEPWLKKCGQGVLYFRVNGMDLEEEDVNRTIPFVPNAQYLPLKAHFHGVKDSYDFLRDLDFQNKVDLESNIITSLKLSGYVTPTDLNVLVDLIPFVEELTLEGSELCVSLMRQAQVNRLNCAVSWTELRKLRISFGNDCLRTFEFIDMCWQMPHIKTLEIEGTPINDITVQYIEDVIDRFRIMDSTFRSNVCSENVQKANNYMCW